MEQKIIIIGGGIAGLSAAQASREVDAQAKITLLCGEGRLPYYRTRICEVFSGTDPEKLTVRNEQWFIDEHIELLYGRAVAVKAEEKVVRLADGGYLDYDKLVIATGSVGNIPKAEGNNRENVLALRSLADIEKINRYPGPVVIIGDGLLGLEAAWHLSRAGRSVVIVGRSERLLSRQLDKDGSVFFLNLVENAGIRVALNGYLQAIDEDLVRLEDGRGFESAVTVFAAGIKSMVRMGAFAGAIINKGIVVNERMQSSVPGIFAAGDCAEYQGRVAGLWTLSIAQGAVAGANAAGGNRVYQPELPAYSMNAMGTKLWSYGRVDVAEGISVKDSQQGNFCKLFFEQGLLVGAELIGDNQQQLALKKAIDRQMTQAEAETIFFKN
jgi:NAD(P)H-nitrite reductase large subunit